MYLLIVLYIFFCYSPFIFSTYDIKSTHFDFLAESGTTSTKSAKDAADDFLGGALKGRSTVIEAETNRLLSDREHGGLAKSTTDEEIFNYAEKIGYHHQATSIVQGGPTTDAMAFLRQQVKAVENEGGATFTTQYGDMRAYKSGGAANQRANNTRLSDAASLHNLPFASANAAGPPSPSEDEAVEWAIQDSLADQQRLYDSVVQPTAESGMIHNASGMLPPPAPVKDMNGFDAECNNLVDETPQAIQDTRDEALLEIMGGGGVTDDDRGVLLQGIVDGLTKPRDQQIEKAHALLERKGNEATERVEGLSKLVANRLRTKKTK